MIPFFQLPQDVQQNNVGATSNTIKVVLMLGYNVVPNLHRDLNLKIIEVEAGVCLHLVRAACQGNSLMKTASDISKPRRPKGIRRMKFLKAMHLDDNMDTIDNGTMDNGNAGKYVRNRGVL